MELDHVKEEETERRQNAVGVVTEGKQVFQFGKLGLERGKQR